MRTPKKYSDELKSGRLSESLISNVIYSVSKRAKNWRDKKECLLDGRYFSHYEAALKQCEEHIDRYYQMKDVILTECGVEPKEIHFVKRYTRPFLACREYCEDFSFFLQEKDESDYWVENPCNCCKSPEKETKVAYKRTDFFLFYDFGGHSFHSPVSEEVADRYDLERIELESLNVPGHNVDDLLSVHFCTKVYDFYNQNIE